MLCPVVHTRSSFFSAWVANTGLPTSLNISSALKNSQNKQNKRTKPQTNWTLGSVPVPSTEHHYDTMYTIYKCMVCLCLMCPVQCYLLTAKTTGSNAQTRITKTSPNEESAWFLCQGQWERNQIFRASVNSFWIVFAFGTEHKHTGTTTKPSITSLLCPAQKPSLGISPAIPKVTEMDMMHSGWAHKRKL